MKEMWDSRYLGDEYVYGVQPNFFFKEKLGTQPTGKILLPAEGEGRNAVYAAQKGLSVQAFDISQTGQQKAFSLAKEKGVTIKYDVKSILDISYANESFDYIGVFFMHLPSEIQIPGYNKLIQKLKTGGILIFELFSINQMKYNSGGPRNPEMLYTVEQLKGIFKDFSTIQIEENEVDLTEGSLHQGKAITIQGYGIKQ